MHQMDLDSLWVTCHLFCMLGVALELSIFFASCLTLLAGYLVRSMLQSLMVFERNSSSQEKPKYISMPNVACFLLVLGLCNLCLYCILPFIHTSFSVSKACKKVRACSDLIRLGLTKFFKFFPYDIWGKLFIG